jgi:hypothetical protein
MAKGEFASFVKSHYDKVRHLPARERLKALGEMYRGGKSPKGGGLFADIMRPIKAMRGGGAMPEGKKRGRKPKGMKGGGVLSEMFGKEKATKYYYDKDGNKVYVEGGGLFSDALDALGPLGAPVAHALGGALPAKGKMRRRPAGMVEEMPMSLVPPSVPVDRRSTAGVNVPGAYYSGVKTFNPHEQAIEMQRRVQPKSMKQAEGTFIKQGASQQTRDGTDLKTIMGMFGMRMPKHMRNVPHGGKLMKKHLKKIYEHTMATHGKEKGGNIFGDMWNGFSKGFVMPFKAVGSVANAIL